MGQIRKEIDENCRARIARTGEEANDAHAVQEVIDWVDANKHSLGKDAETFLAYLKGRQASDPVTLNKFSELNRDKQIAEKFPSVWVFLQSASIGTSVSDAADARRRVCLACAAMCCSACMQIADLCRRVRACKPVSPELCWVV